jgi:hypothetical protein
MRSKEEKPLKELVNQMLRAYGLGDRLDEVSLLKSWEDICGKMIARHTRDIYFKSGTLYVELDSAPLRQELSYARTKLIERLNEHAGRTMVKDIVFK